MTAATAREWAKPLIQYLIYAVVAVLIVDCALASRRETARLRWEARRLRAQIACIRRQNRRLQKLQDALRQDPFVIERVLREHYGHRRPDEEGVTFARYRGH
ncbi:MAG: hypothetical protein ACOC8E_08955 [Planctomycetota bacterium]